MKSKQKAVRTALPPVSKVEPCKETKRAARKAADAQTMGGITVGHNARGSFITGNKK
jgi:hypothetical protein